MRALLRDVLCGYLDPDLKIVADDILLESNEGPFPEIQARDLRSERFAARAGARVRAAARAGVRAGAGAGARVRAGAGAGAASTSPEPMPEPAAVAAPLLLEEEEIDTSEMDRLQAEGPHQPHLEGVTPSDDWAYDDPEDYSAPV